MKLSLCFFRSKRLQGEVRNHRGLLTEFGDGGGFPKVGFPQRAGDQQISMCLALGIEGSALGISGETKTQRVIAQHTGFDERAQDGMGGTAMMNAWTGAIDHPCHP